MDLSATATSNPLKNKVMAIRDIGHYQMPISKGQWTAVSGCQMRNEQNSIFVYNAIWIQCSSDSPE